MRREPAAAGGRGVGAATVESGNQAHFFLWLAGFGGLAGPIRLLGGEVGHDPLKVAGRDGDVGVVDEQEIVAGVVGKLGESADLAVASQAGGTLDKLNGMSGKLPLETLDDDGGGVVEGGNTEEQFIFAQVGLAAVAAKGVDHAQVDSFEGLEDADAGGKGGQRGAPGG